MLRHIQAALTRLTGAELLVLPEHHRSPARWVRLLDVLRGRWRGGEVGVLLAPAAADLQALRVVPNWRRRFAVLAAYVFDSWYTEWFTVESRLFDVIFVSRIEDVDPVRARTGRPVHYVPFGTDVVAAGPHVAAGDRPTDLLVYGRQPPAYGYEVLKRYPAPADLRVRLNVPFDPDPDRNQHNLFEAAGSAKFALGFCNSVHYYAGLPPKSPFITFRWVDNLAAGAIMVGRVPRPAGFEQVVGWGGAYVDLPDDPGAGLEVVAECKRRYHPSTGLRTHYQSLVRNDWRLRLREMFRAMGVPVTPVLGRELARHAEYAAEVEARLAPAPAR